jgi:hypothetical protein
MYGIFLCFFPIPSIHSRSIIMCKKILHLDNIVKQIHNLKNVGK